MKLLRVGPRDAERPAVLTADGCFDLSGLCPDIDGAFLAGDGPQRAAQAVADGWLPALDLATERVGAPIARPGKVVCIGLNYRTHAQESGQPVPTEPIVFMKASDTVVGPDDDVHLPPGSTKTDYEVELAVVVGRTARYLATPADAIAHVAGFAVSNDVSERAYQLERGGQWDKGKSCETFNPLGPWLVTPDEVDLAALGLRTRINGELRQDGRVADMIFDVPYLIWYLSQFMVLYPGDVVNTGTPAGVALGLPGQPYLRADDVMELEIDGLGRQRQRCVPAPTTA